jgi:hypothetical protein
MFRQLNLLPSSSNKVPALMGKAKIKLSLCFNWTPRHEGVLESGVIAPRILYLGTRWRWVVSFTPDLPPGEEPLVPIE